MNRTPRLKTRTIFLRYFSLIAVILIDVSFLSMLDSLFDSKKRMVIYDNQSAFNDLIKQLDPIVGKLKSLRGQYANETLYHEKAKEYLAEKDSTVLDEDNPWYMIILFDEEQNVIYRERRPEKLLAYNTWNNCLFSRSFHGVGRHPYINLHAYYATPKGWEEIQTMVWRYRIYALMFIVTTFLMYWWLYNSVVLPLQHVGQSMESMIKTERVSLIPHPRHTIEEVYNQLARNQREVFYGIEIDRLLDSLHALSDESEVLEAFLKQLATTIQRVYPFQSITIYQYLRTQHTFIEIHSGRNSDLHPKSESVRIEDKQGHILLSVGDPIVAAIQFQMDPDSELDQEEISRMAHEIKKQTENGLARAMTRSQALTEERNRFGINLATNMGHDLTNIIASGKWDLDTIQRAQSLGIVSMDPKKGSFFSEAVEGLKNNLDFLQKMVDIYRSFGYTRKPYFEKVDLGQLISEVTNLFRLSTSQKMAIEVFDKDKLEVTAEPRLLRMALFNLLANASQAIQRSPIPNQKGIIEVEYTKIENGLVDLSVRDNGPGIRDSEGKLMPKNEINRIFHSGYSTKEASSGGGLGLSWVKSIMEEFHHGTIYAENRPEGGACFHLSFPENLNPDDNSVQS